MERPDVVDVNVLLGAEGRDDDRQADCRFGGRDGDHEESEDLAGVLQPEAGEGNEQQVRRVEHQLDAHQHHQRVAADDDADDADEEKYRGEREIVADGDRHQSVPSRRMASRIARSALAWLRAASASRICSPPRVMTPMTATIRISAVTSKGSS